MPDWSAILDALRETGADMPVQTAPRAVGGGDISAAWRVGDLFVKTGPPQSAEMFAAEAEGLSELARPAVIRVPEVVGYGLVHETAWLATRWIAFARATRATETKLGEQLAALHAVTAERFGWHRNNTIGLTPQVNDWSDDWVAFYRDHRLGFQLQLAADNGFSLGEPAARLMQRIPAFFDGYSPAASLLHGDLWGGNWGSCDGEPVIFDPAVYFGDRESDLAMTRLFGGFGRAFYEAYENNAPLAPGHRQRSDLYQLYHVLNHLNLFGSAYLGRAQALIQNLLRESR
jgi:fructosamine-3-kinase